MESADGEQVGTPYSVLLRHSSSSIYGVHGGAKLAGVQRLLAENFELPEPASFGR